MLRRLLTYGIETYLPWLPVAFAALFGFIVHQPSQTFEQYKIAHSVSAGPVSWFFWVTTFLLFTLGGVAFFYVLISPTVLGRTNPGYSIVNLAVYNWVGDIRRKATRMMVASALYGITAGAYTLQTGTVLALDRANAIREDSAYLFSMIGDGGTVGLDIFSWGYFDPQIEFALQTFLLVIIATIVIRNYVTVRDLTVFTVLSGGVVLTHFGALFTGTEVFPIDARFAFLVQLLITFGMLVVLVAGIYLTVWGFGKTVLGGARKTTPERPSQEEFLLGAFILLVALPVFSSPIAAVLTWASVVVSWLDLGEAFGHEAVTGD